MLLAATLTIDAVYERVDHYLAAHYAELRQQALGALTGDSDKDAPNERLVSRRILPDHQHERATIEPSPVEDRPPLHSEVLRRVNRLVRIVFDERLEWLLAVAGIELDDMNSSPEKDVRARGTDKLLLSFFGRSGHLPLRRARGWPFIGRSCSKMPRKVNANGWSTQT
ncbi:MAG TPA: hypothetical protein VKD23_09320 [Terriglobales bacterium]|nr:hypothetical protein [Terriglobales bacterium]